MISSNTRMFRQNRAVEKVSPKPEPTGVWTARSWSLRKCATNRERILENRFARFFFTNIEKSSAST